MLHIICLGIALSVAAQETPSPSVIQKAISEARHLCPVATMSAERKWRLRDNARTSWVESPESERIELTFELSPEGRFEIAFDPIFSPWVGAKSPFMEERKRWIYDGQRFITLMDRVGPRGDTAEARECIIEDGKDARNHQELVVPLQVSLGIAPLVDSSTGFQDALRFGGSQTPKVEWNANGHLNVVFRFDFGGFGKVETFTLNTRNGFYLERHFSETLRKGTIAKGPRHEWLASEHVAIAPSVFFPQKVVFRRWDADGELERVEEWSFSGARAIAGELPAFKAKVPPGYTVTDKRLGISFTAGENPEQLIDSLRKETKNAK